MYFHNGNHIKTIQFHDHECLREFVHVADLLSGEYLHSKHPYVLIKDNGVAIAIDSSISSLVHYNQDHVQINSYTLEFITTCHEVIKDEALSHEESQTPFITYPFFIIFIIAIGAVIVRRFL